MIKRTKSYSEREYHKYISDRNKALCSLNMNKIKRFMKKYEIEISDNENEFWIDVAQNILRISEIESNYIPAKIVVAAKTILDEFNLKYSEGGNEEETRNR